MPPQYSYYDGRSRPPAQRTPVPKRHRKPIKKFLMLALLLFIGIFLVQHTEHTRAEESKAYVAAQKVAKQKAATTKLVGSWKSILANAQGSVDIAVYDNTNGETVHYTNASGTYNTASIVKLSILEDLLLQDQQKGESLTSAQLTSAKPMIENSDNNAATTLWNLDGGTSALNSFFTRIGATDTTAGTAGYWGLTQTTAIDQLKVVNQIAYPSKLLTASSVSQADNLLNNVESDQKWGVSGGVPSTASVQLKNGWLDDTDGWDINSIGHVHGDGVDYTIAVLTDQNDTEQDGINTIESLSATTWTTLSEPT